MDPWFQALEVIGEEASQRSCGGKLGMFFSLCNLFFGGTAVRHVKWTSLSPQRPHAAGNAQPPLPKGWVTHRLVSGPSVHTSEIPHHSRRRPTISANAHLSSPPNRRN